MAHPTLAIRVFILTAAAAVAVEVVGNLLALPQQGVALV
tara:strand:- start:207 stop:323 length:117 start_codon:yes stop_codon:yes gene_type:complete